MTDRKYPRKVWNMLLNLQRTILHGLAKFEMFYTNFALVWFGKCKVLVI